MVEFLGTRIGRSQLLGATADLTGRIIEARVQLLTPRSLSFSRMAVLMKSDLFNAIPLATAFWTLISSSSDTRKVTFIKLSYGDTTYWVYNPLLLFSSKKN